MRCADVRIQTCLASNNQLCAWQEMGIVYQRLTLISASVRAACRVAMRG